MALTSSGSTDDAGATVVITHRVRTEKHADYERWLDEIRPLSTASPGCLDWHVVRPIAGITETYTVVIRFDNEANLKLWMDSPDRARMIAKAQPLLVTGDDFFINSGLDFWFAPVGTKVPVRWKQALLTWSAIFPLALTAPLVILPALTAVGVSLNHALATLLITGVMVLIMVYVIMPRYTRLMRRWLFK